MDIKKFSDDLMKKMNIEIGVISLEEEETTSRTSRIIACVERYMRDLKAFTVNYVFKTPGEEIEFFKYLKPAIASRLFFYRKLRKVHTYVTYRPANSRVKYLLKQLQEVESFVRKHEQFYNYMASHSSNLDSIYFKRDESVVSFVIDNRFSTIYERRYSKILGYESFKEYLLKSIERAQSPSFCNPRLTWTGSKTDLIELIYALQVSGNFNKSQSDVKQIAEFFEDVFNVKLGNFYRTFQEIKLRKNEKAGFLFRLKELMERRISESDR